jgi:23S rRNA (guanosine2251-2'-O)-methyltransferase
MTRKPRDETALHPTTVNPRIPLRKRRRNSPPHGAAAGRFEAAANEGPVPAASSTAGEGRAGRWIYGRHAVAAALANPRRRWSRLAALAGQEREARALVDGARAQRCDAGDPIRLLDRPGFAKILPDGAVHQGLALAVEPLAAPDLTELLQLAAAACGRQVIVVLDQISDPHNVGAVVRSAAAFGALAVVVSAHGAPAAAGALAKAASGALEGMPLVKVVNLARTLDRLKEAGFWICGLDESAPQTLAALDLGERVAVVLGSEGRGVRRLVRERCDHLARLPTRAEQPSINVSNAAAVALYELMARQ